MDEILGAAIRDGGLGLQVAMGVAGTVSAAVAGGLVIAGPLGRMLLPRPSEARVRDLLPFDRVLNDGSTIACRDGRMVTTLRLAGQDSAALSPGEKDALHEKRQAFVDSFQTRANMEVLFVTRRRLAGVGIGGGRWEAPALQSLFDRYYAGFQDPFINEHGLVLAIPPAVSDGRQKLQEAVETTRVDLADYGVEILSNGKANYSPLLTFWAELVNPGMPVRIGSTQHDVSQAISASVCEFTRKDGVMVFRDGPRTTYGAALGIPKWGDITAESTMARLLSLPLEMVVTHMLKPFSLLDGQARIELRRKWTLGGKFGGTAAEQLSAAGEMLTPGSAVQQGLMRYQATIFLYASSMAGLEDAVLLARQEMRGLGITLVRHGAGPAERLWWSQFPGHRQFVTSQDFFSGNVADLVALDSPAVGSDRSDWAPEPVCVVRQVSGAPYSFNFHCSPEPEEVGHMVVIGPTGGGKSMLMNVLIGASLRFPGVKWYRFDRDEGALPFTMALGPTGRYISLDGAAGAESCQLNPLYMLGRGATEADVSFVRRWLRDRVGAEVANDPDCLADLARVVRSANDPSLSDQQRNLRAVVGQTLKREGRLYQALAPWIDPEMFGKYINAQRDTFDASDGVRQVAIGMTRILKDNILAPAIVDYLFHRIMTASSAAGTPVGIFIDEAESLVRESQDFRDRLRVVLQEFRRARGVVVLAFQRPNAIRELGLEDLILGQCRTKIFRNSPGAHRQETT